MFSRTAKARGMALTLKWDFPESLDFTKGVGLRAVGLAGLFLAFLLSVVPARAALQFDVFAGFDETIREGNWFPVTFEVFNDGPSFNGVIELSTAQAGSGQMRRVAVELPTHTRKRIVLPVFAQTRFATWDAKLLDEKGNLRADKQNIRFSSTVAASAFLLASIPKSQAGRPEFPRTSANANDRAPKVVRLTSELLPDNPIAMEGMQALYLSSERAVELKGPQITALITWVYQGGHLLVGVEQAADLAGAPWLRRLSPIELTGSAQLKLNGAFNQWIRSSSSDPEPRIRRSGGRRNALGPEGDSAFSGPAPSADDGAFDLAEMVFATGKLAAGAESLLAVGSVPAVASMTRGRGSVTLLTFSPDREPFRSWSNRAWFWSRLAGLPNALFAPNAEHVFASLGSDGIFGAMLDSRQVRKLPVEWLLLLLVVYLVVIGPLDQYWLKKINKQMWTWVTFPAYVAFFSVLIYFIAAKLRAGDMEFNELHVVDAVPHGEKSDLRGRSFASLYSPVNAQYPVSATNHGFASVRGEFHGGWGGGADSSRLTLDQKGNGSMAELFVPVWTSQLFVHEWLLQGESAVTIHFAGTVNSKVATLRNHLNRDLAHVHVAYRGRLYTVGAVPAGQSVTTTLGAQSGQSLVDFVSQNGGVFPGVVQGRRQAFGRESARLDSNPQPVIAASFGRSLESGAGGQQFGGTGGFVFPEGFELTDDVARGDAVVFAWVPDYSPVEKIHRFEPKRSQRNTMFRMIISTGEP